MKQSLALSIIAVVITTVIAVTVLIALDKDPGAVLQMIVFVLPILVVQLFQGKQLDTVLEGQQTSNGKLAAVQESINGKLHGKLDTIVSEITSKGGNAENAVENRR